MEKIKSKLEEFKKHLEEKNKGFQLKNAYLISICDKFDNNKNINNIQNNIKFISKLSEIENEKIYVIDEKILHNLGYTKEVMSKYELTFMKISDKIQQIIFKNKSKLNIKNDKILQFIESPNPTNNIDNIKYDIIKNKNNYFNNPFDNYKIKNSFYDIDKNKNEMISNKNNEFNKEEKKLKNNDNKKIINEKESILRNNLNKIYEKIKNIILPPKSLFLYKDDINKEIETINYYIVNKIWYIKLIKIFESDDIYENDNIILDDIKNILKLNENELNNINDNLIKRKKILEDGNLQKVNFEKIDEYEFPINFAVINKNLDFLKIYNINENKYRMIFIENILFIFDNKNNKNIYAYSIKNNICIEEEAIFIFDKEEDFKKELKRIIENKGLLSYYKDIDLEAHTKELQRIFNSDGDLVGGIKIINKNLVKESNNKKGITNENIINNMNSTKNIADSDNNNINEINNNKNSDYNYDCEDNDIKINNPKGFNNIIKNNSLNLLDNQKNNMVKNNNPYIKYLFLAFLKIEKLKLNFKIKENNINNISALVNNLIKNNKNFEICINEIENKINEINLNVLKDVNFEKLIDFILNKLHEELNNKKFLNNEELKEDYEWELLYKNFKSDYLTHNDSIIQKIFFGVKERVILYNCCGLTKYSFDIIKYISFDLENVNQKQNLANLIFKWENCSISDKIYCNMCNIKENSFIKNKLKDSPEILIIIIKNNKNKVELDINKIIKTKNYEFSLLCSIFANDQGKDNNIFNVVYNEDNKWFVFRDNDIPKEIGNDIGKFLLNSIVLFYQRGKEIIIENESNEEEISNNKYISHILTESNYFQSQSMNFMKNSGLNKINIINNNLNIYNNINDDKNNNNNNCLNNYPVFNSINNNNINNSNITIKTNIVMNCYPNKLMNSNIINYNINDNNINRNNNQEINNNLMNNNNNFMNNNINNQGIVNNINYMNNNNQMNKNMNINYNNYNNFNFKDYQNNNNMMNNNCINQIGNNVINNNINNNIIFNNNNWNKNNEYSYDNNEIIDNKKEIVLNFIFEDGKELHINADESIIFKDAIGLLYDKYKCIENIKIRDFIYNKYKLDLNKSIKENGLKDNSIIKIIEGI